MDVGAWLRELGLGQYEAAFAESEIDATVLPDITLDDLKEIGVASVGHRRKILAAAAQLAAPSPAAAPPPAAADAAERRQLTVMFCDLVGSTALSARLDPEDMRRVIRAYQDAVSGVVARYDGFVAKFMGDGILAYFGFPRAHEDDAARAVHAGLEIAEVVSGLQTPAREKLEARIGVATGLVVVGDLVGQGPAQEQAVVGDTPNLAARLQGLAEAGGVVVAAATRRLLGDRFALRGLGKHVVKGLAEPVEAWAALGVSQSESRFEAAHASRLTGFVGREAESAMLVERQRRAWSGQGQIVLISGEAGIGKSRLSAWLAEQVADTPHTRLRYQCSPYHRDSALYPFVQQFERAAGISPQEPSEAKLEKLEKVLVLATDRMGEVAPLIAAMLSIPTGNRYRPLSLSPAQQRRQTLFALLDQMEGLAKKQPVLMLFEDAHWADATSLEVLDLAIERMRKLPVLLLITFRPEFEAPWKGLPDVGEISLRRLDRAQAETLVERVTGGRKLPAEVMAQILAKTDGVPLFVEELTKNVLESGLLVEDGERFRLDGPLPPLAIPSTLQDSLMARLDRLAAVKEIAQIGAAVGREFSYALLLAVVGRDEATLRAALAQLEDSELVFRSGEPPDARYTFKHALVQDTAYESLLKSRRQILHRRIAETLRDKFPDVVEAEPELLAHHFTQAGLSEPAVEYWGKAGDLALRRSAFKEAIAHLGKAIEMTEAGAGEKEAPGEKLKLQVAYGNAMLSARGHGSPESAAAFQRARELTTGVADVSERSSVTYGLWVGSFIRGELGAMRELVDALLREVEARPDLPEAGVAHRIKGVTHWFAGEFVEARAHIDRALAVFDPERDRDLAFRFGQDVGISAMAFSALTLWALGEVDRARERADAMAARSDEIQHAGTAAFVHLFAARFEFMRRDPTRAAPHAATLVILARELEMEQWSAHANMLEGWADWRAGAGSLGLAGLRQAISFLRAKNYAAFDPLNDTILAEAETEAGEFDAALATIDHAFGESARTGQRWLDAELHRARGEILLKQNPADPAAAEESFLIAIAIAQQQKTRSFELRAALSLAKLYRATGRDDDAYPALGSALEGFSPTPEFPEIGEAQALFEALAQIDGVKTASASKKQHVRLQVSYGNALRAARGIGALETSAAFKRARELATGVENAEERFSGNYGLWAGSYVRGELGAMRELASEMLRDCASRPNSSEAGTAHRINGTTNLFAGEFVEAREQLDRAMTLFDPERDRDLKFRYFGDIGVSTMAANALVYWALGEVEQARRFVDDMLARSDQAKHVLTTSMAHLNRATFEIMRRDPIRAAPSAAVVAGLSRDHEMPQFAEFGYYSEAWAAWSVGDRKAAMAKMREGVALSRANRIVIRTPLFQANLAEAEAEAGEIDAALATLDAALAETQSNGQRCFDAELHRIRGEILLKQNPADRAVAEAAFLTAIAIARAQKARSFELRAALSLAKLYQSTDRAIEAHDVLGPALEGFSPTPEFPEIAEAKALLEALSQSSVVKSAQSLRVRQVQLQIALGNAMIATRGHGAPETTTVFAKAREMAAGIKDASARSSIIYGLWVGCYSRAELGPMRELAAAFLKDAEANPDSPEAGVAHRINGVTCWFEGDYANARAHYERALAILDRVRDRDLAVRFGQDQFVASEILLALVLWPLGEVDEAVRLAEEALRHAREGGQVSTMCYLHMWSLALEILRNDPARLAVHVESLAALSREHDLQFFAIMANRVGGWLDWRSGAGIEKFSEGNDAFRKLGYGINFPGLVNGLAHSEADAGHGDVALSIIDNLIADNERKGQAWLRAEDHRTRGEILLKQNSAAPAEEAFLTAIAISQHQKARSFELRAALALAKLYRATGREADAHAALGPALEGFSPTPEFPEIAEARALFEALERTEEIKTASATKKQRVRLQVSYGNALLAARGLGAPETTAAFKRARELPTAGENAEQRFSVNYGLWAGSYVRGELGAMREVASEMLRDCASRPNSGDAGSAHRVNGATNLFAGEFVEAREQLDKALTLFDPERDSDLKFRYFADIGVSTMGFSAFVYWALGEVEQARRFIDDMLTRADQAKHVGSVTVAHISRAEFEIMRGDPTRAAPSAAVVVGFGRDHEMPQFAEWGSYSEAWAAWKLGDRKAIMEKMREGVALARTNRVVIRSPLFQANLAEAEVEAGEVDAALATVDAALADTQRNGQRCFDAELHRIRGEILLKQNPANPAPAEEAFLTAIAISQHQKARSFELRAALALAKLYRATGREADAHAALGPALEGFSPTPEFPEIAVARALFDALEQTDEVKTASASKKRRLRLQVSYGNAVMAARGHGALETTAAFERARELSTGVANADERHWVNYGLWFGSYVRGELGAMRELATEMLRDCASRPNSREASSAYSINGATHLHAGEFVEAREQLDIALTLFDPERDRDLKFRTFSDIGVGAMVNSAIAYWVLGHNERARRFVDDMVTRADQAEHVGTATSAHVCRAVFEIIRRDPIRAAPSAALLAGFSRDHEMPHFADWGYYSAAWAAWTDGDGNAKMATMREGLALRRKNRIVIHTPLIEANLAEAEAEAGEFDAALATLDAALADTQRNGQRWFDAELHRIRGEVLLKQDSANPLPAEAAFLTAIAISQHQKARSFELRAALAIAKLYRATGREADAHVALGPALEGFSPTPEFPEIAEARALFEALERTEEIKTASATKKQRVRLQVSYGNALLAARGLGAPETTAAFKRARELTTGVENAEQSFLVNYGLWVGSVIRGELGPMRELAAEMSRDCASRPNSSEACTAHRVNGATNLFAGEFVEAREQLDKALTLFDPERDSDLKFRYFADIGVSTMGFSAFVYWALGEVEQARRFIDDMLTRADQAKHVGSVTVAHISRAEFEIMRGDPTRAAPSAAVVVGLGRDHEMPQFAEWGSYSEAWAAWKLGDRKAIMEKMREGVALARTNRVVIRSPLFQANLAEAEVEAGEVDAALATVDAALADTQRNGQRCFDAELHRIRGEILLKQNPANPAPAEEAFLTAIAISQHQKARSFELRAALALAKLYRATGREADAHAALGPALEGFSPTPEFPEIAEAQALIDALAQTDGVMSASASNKQRLRLHVSYGNALLAARGLGALETTAAFKRARELATGVENAEERFWVNYGLWVGSNIRGEIGLMRELASEMSRDCASRSNSSEASIAHRVNGTTNLFAGEFVEAREQLDKALTLFDPERDRDLKFRSFADIGVSTMGLSAFVYWALGEVEQARRFIDRMLTRADQAKHVGTTTVAHVYRAEFEIMRGDPTRAAPSAAVLAGLSRDHEMPQFAMFAYYSEAWAAWTVGDRKANMAKLREGLALRRENRTVIRTPLFQANLAEAEAAAGEIDAALATLDTALADTQRNGQRSFDAELHRIRGEILLKQDPANSAAAEEAFHSAIAISRHQKARSFELRAALALAKLYRSTGRSADARAALGPALEGFTPTPDFSEVAEARAFLAAPFLEAKQQTIY